MNPFPRPDLSITIITWNKTEYISKCLKSVFDKINNVGFEVIVVDNGSTDGTAALLAGSFRRLKQSLTTQTWACPAREIRR